MNDQSVRDLPRYSGIAMTLHWLVALLMVCNVLLIWSVDYWPKTWTRPVIDTHKSIGITVLGLALLRLLWRIANPPPALPASYARWERLSSHATHLALYGLMFALPLSGWLHDSAWKQAATHPMKLFTFIPWPRIAFIMHLDATTKESLHTLFSNIHTALAYVLFGLFVLHVAGALKHQWVDKEPELQRMLPGKRAK